MGEIILYSGYPRVKGINWPPTNEILSTADNETTPPGVREAQEDKTPIPKFIHDLRAGQMTTATSKIIPPIS